MLSLSTGGYGTIGVSSTPLSCLPPSSPLHQLSYTLLAPARDLGKTATFGNFQKRSGRPFSSIGALPKPHEESSYVSCSFSSSSDDDDGVCRMKHMASHL